MIKMHRLLLYPLRNRKRKITVTKKNMILERFIQILSIALEAVFLNKFRSMLTALGIIFGVAAVIAMMAIGNGARQEILDEIKLVGVNNIVITPVLAQGKNNENGDKDEGKSLKKKYSPGLTVKDAQNIAGVIPTVKTVSPELIFSSFGSRKGKKTQVKLSGVTASFFSIYNIDLKKGVLFNSLQEKQGAPVCVIGPEVEAKLFSSENALGKYIKVENIWLKVIGVVKGVNVDKKSKSLGVSDYNKSVFAPLKTLLLRHKDRSLVNQASLMGGGQVVFFGLGSISISDDGGNSTGLTNENQLDKIVVQVNNSDELAPTAKAITKILSRRHQNLTDFEIKIPELLLKQEQKTKDIFNIVLGAIAGISLIVGGIGIMNIMLASVMERIREIGVRCAVGATKHDIVFQFLAESIFISITGGFIGVLLGVIMAKIITATTGILTIISFWSILISFGVAAGVGIVFGYLPAKKASEQDPVESLRHD